MSPLGFLAVLVITTTFVASSTLSPPSHKPNSGAPVPAPAALQPSSHPLSHHPQLAPDDSPLLPSSGVGSAHSPVGVNMPTIPSSRSPPNPDSLGSAGLDANFGPSSLVQDSSGVSGNLVKGLGWILGFWVCAGGFHCLMCFSA